MDRHPIEMPFTGMITSIPQICHSCRKKWDPTGTFSTLNAWQLVAFDLLGIVAGQEGCSGGPTTGGVIKLCESHSIDGQFIQVRRLDFTAVASQIRKSEVVRHDQKHVGWHCSAGWTRCCTNRCILQCKSVGSDDTAKKINVNRKLFGSAMHASIVPLRKRFAILLHTTR